MTCVVFWPCLLQASSFNLLPIPLLQILCLCPVVVTTFRWFCLFRKFSFLRVCFDCYLCRTDMSINVLAWLRSCHLNFCLSPCLAACLWLCLILSFITTVPMGSCYNIQYRYITACTRAYIPLISQRLLVFRPFLLLLACH
jgi:hypothetical protein